MRVIADLCFFILVLLLYSAKIHCASFKEETFEKKRGEGGMESETNENLISQF